MFLREAWYVPVGIARQYGTRAALRRRQLTGLNRMLAHARAHVPYYRDDPDYARTGPLRTLAELAELPVIDKEVLRGRPLEELLADGARPGDLPTFRTSGSTGRRVTVVHDRHSHDYHMACCVRRFLATGRYLPTDRLSHIRPFAPPSRGFEKAGLFRRHVLLTDRPMTEIKAALLAARPQVLIGYPVHLRALLRALTPAELARLRGTLKLVMTESELLVDAHRALFEREFGAPVHDEYSAFEVLNIAYDCAHGRAHLAEDRLLVEILGADGRPVPDGEEGRVTVTAFMERAMPLIRYDLGDVGRIDPRRCPCGRRFRTLRLTAGRVNDAVLLPSGRQLYPDAFLHLAATFPGVDECGVHQDATGAVRLSVVPSEPGDPSPDAWAGLRDRVHERVIALAGCDFPLEVVRVDRVEITAGGKGRFVTSELTGAPSPGAAGPV
ncbi:phenylacetate--CoA ligase family protein [Streptomyces jumonjinensis]|uniref:Phenylacetate--CoA ligase family protein n=1 Tax=Streptomyces jumonjinensis TaxID=1945 RepID=A0A646KAJ1_STRJU|nr:phenylacetate--CoA ligase family protein [Streptomyces jumonjinensis]MQS98916.1 phenylacetate--CoA ligase family protein [Streptomyces jumonjinensis]